MNRHSKSADSKISTIKIFFETTEKGFDRRYASRCYEITNVFLRTTDLTKSHLPEVD